MPDWINPEHYKSESGLEAIEVIDAFFSNNPYRANVFKYLKRAGVKGPAKEIEDLRKAAWYLSHEIALLESEEKAGTHRPVEARPEIGDRYMADQASRLVDCRFFDFDGDEWWYEDGRWRYYGSQDGIRYLSSAHEPYYVSEVSSE